MSYNNTTQLQTICLACGTVKIISGTRNKLKGIGHVEPGYCYVCKKETPQYNIQDSDLFLANHEGEDIVRFDPNTQKVIGFLKKRQRINE